MKKTEPIITDNNTCLVHYKIKPAITAEGDESRLQALNLVKDAFKRGHVEYTGFTFTETPERLVPEYDHDKVTNLFFVIKLKGITPFNDENDFTPGILQALKGIDGTVTGADFYEDSGHLKRLEITLNKILNKPAE